MSYEETINYLYNSVPMFERVGAVAYKEGLYNSEELDSHFDHPHRKYKTIHIAGTNGKGSCSHTIAAILQVAGLKVGLYTSPHLVDFRERIKINGKCIGKDYVVRFVEEERDFFEPLHPSFFELTTALAFKYFAEQKVDVAVIEVGLGGRLDCTNIIMPVLSIITNISFDHTQFLGDTLAKIAGEKAGIIKKGVPVVIGEANGETRPVFMQKAKEQGCPIVFAEDARQVLTSQLQENGGISYKTVNFGELHGELGGIYQEKNANTVLCAMKLLMTNSVFPALSETSVKTGFAKVIEETGLLGRWQTLRSHPTVICDTGHNVGGWQYLCKQLQMQKCRKMRIVFGMVDDKDINTVIRMLPKSAIYYFTKASTKRAMSETDIMKLGLGSGLEGRCFKDVPAAYNQALEDSNEKDFVFVGGSSYIVADLLTYKMKHD